jgi:hypothetical protein|tara:strand:+ start:48 stop:356 length:309 start_codon:yes stop_codon:yes gene_type:complete
MLTEGAVKLMGAFSIAFLLLYIFSNRGITREGAKGCSKDAKNIAVTQQSEIDQMNSGYTMMKAELEEFKKNILQQKTEIQHNETKLKQILAEKKKDLPSGVK